MGCLGKWGQIKEIAAAAAAARSVMKLLSPTSRPMKQVHASK